MIAVYTRVSTREQLNGYGIDSQLSLIMDYCHQQGFDKDDIKIYSDPGFSAAGMNRPMLKKMIGDIQNGLIHSVICQKLDRLARGLDIQAKIFNILNKYNVTLLCSHDDIQMHTANGRLVINIQGSVAEWERDTIIERTYDGMRQSAREGNYPIGSKAPFGYKKVSVEGSLTAKRLQINEEEAEVVRFIFHRLGRGHSIADTLVFLNSNYGAMKNWNYDNIYSIINKRIYYGLFDYYDLHLENHTPAIITKEQWEKAQVRKYQKSERYIERGYLFKGLARCKICDEMIINTAGTSSTGQIYAYYKCPKCKKTVNEQRVSKAYSQAYLEIQYNNLEQVDYRLSELEVKKDSLINMYVENLISISDFQKSLVALNERYEASLQIKTNTKNGYKNPLVKDRDLNKLMIKEVLREVQIDYVLNQYTFYFISGSTVLVDEREGVYYTKSKLK